tara:strand:- start:1136 stop:2890 length:1755 start_codon:yes stop_codon:yes gene_type:complete
MELDKLLVRIEADLSQLKKQLNSANKQVTNTSNNIKKQLNDAGKSFVNLGGQVLKFGGILATAFGAFQIKKVVDVGIQIENLEVRLKALFGSAEEGAKAFDRMVEFASKVPFSLEEIQQSSGNLAVVADDADELAELLKITGNVAGATGLSFQQTAEQIQRSFSGGIASADVFRERGVRAMLGFQVGAEVSISETVQRFKEVFGKGGEFGNVTEDLANTLTGTLSMLGDKLFSFRKAIADEFFEEFKRGFKDLNETLEINSATVQKFGRDIGIALAEFTKSVINNIDEIILAFKVLGSVLAGSVLVKIVSLLTKMNPLIRGISIAVGAMTIGFEKASQQNLTKSLTNQDKALISLNETYNLAGKGALRFKETQDKVKEALDTNFITVAKVNSIIDVAKEKFADAGESISDAFGEAIVRGKDFGEAMNNIFRNLVSQIISAIAQILIINPLIEALTEKLENYQKTLEKSSGFKGGFLGKVGSFIGDAVTGMIGKSTGGYVASNKPFLVGERGAEVFVPRTAGNIIPNNQMGGGVTVNQNISFSTGLVGSIRAEVLNLLPVIKQETINAVAETRSRGGAFAKTFGG